VTIARVLCPTDLSKASTHAAEWAVALPFEQGFALAQFRRHCEQSAQSRLESLVPASLHRPQAPIVRLRSGKPYVQILHVAAEEKTDLIVIGVHGRNPLDMAVFGSTTNQVVRQATCPVLTLRH
jgi:hypothetical protein